MANRRSLRGELHDAPGDCCLQLDPLDVPGDSFRTAKSHNISTASCLLKKMGQESLSHESFILHTLERLYFS